MAKLKSLIKLHKYPLNVSDYGSNSHCLHLLLIYHLFFQSFSLLQLLHLLPAHETSILVKEGIPLWLSLVFPSLMTVLEATENKEKVHTCLSYVEILIKQLVQYDYFECPEWQIFLGSVVDAKQ